MPKDKNQGTFQRYETKYLLNQPQYLLLMKQLKDRIYPDEFCESTICNIYYDTPDFQLIRASLDKPVYKEKLRLRSYGVPTPDSKVFLEIKKKYHGIVYKRRVPMTLLEAEQYLTGIARPKTDCQILREIDWFRKFYGDLEPAVCLCYDREAYVDRNNSNLRYTVDTNIRWRRDQIDLQSGDGGAPLLDEGQHLLELKVPDSMPLWLVQLLESLDIHQTSFSKYGAIYQTNLAGSIAGKGRGICA